MKLSGINILGSVFLMVGLISAASKVPILYHAINTLNWHTTKATVISASLEQKLNKKINLNNTKYQPKATYTYKLDNKPYTNHRVSFYEDFDNIGEFQKNLGLKLISAKNTGTTISIWYDPKKPSESIINKTFRIIHFISAMLLSSIFIGFGAGILYLENK